MLRAILLVLLATTVSAQPRRVIVEFTRPPLADGKLRTESDGAVVARLQGDTAVRVREPLLRALNGAIVELPDDATPAEIARLPYVARVTPDAEVSAFAAPPARDGSVATVRPSAGAGSGVVVAVIDSGIDRFHPALAGKVVGGWDFVNDDVDPSDDNRHGTHVAGIIAAESAEVTGMAPGATLLAYKVLDARGKGSMSDIIAAIERAMDPNGDGDPSDHAGVINLSLGGPGHPDDPLSRAVENAVAAGIVVCAAAGNDGLFHAIGSPAAAPSAITVGAYDGDNETVADFSNRGPSTGTGAIKPEILAPGVSIRSTVPGGGTMKLSGTSMATPYVAGLAALIRAAHPDWSPARVKAAIVGSGTPVLEHEVMAQGTGLVDADRAAGEDLEIQPPLLNAGLDSSRASTWSAERKVTITNHAALERAVAIAPTGAPAGVTVGATPSQLLLGPGASAEVTVTLTVNHLLLGDPQSPSLSFGGRLLLQYDGGAQAWLPWAFIRAARATVTWPGRSPQVLWQIPAGYQASHALLGASGLETLVEPGTFDLTVVASGDGEARVVVAEQTAIEGDVALAFTDADAPHAVQLAALPAAADGAKTLYSVIARLIQPEGSVPLTGTGRVIRTSSFSDRYSLLATESFVDTENRTIFVAQHPPLQGISSSATLGVPAGGFAMQDVVIRARPGVATQDLLFMPRDWPRRSSEFAPPPPSIAATAGGAWSGTLYFTGETHPDFGSGVQVQTRPAGASEGPAWTFTPMIRRTADGFAAFRGFDRPAVPSGVVGGEPLDFGGGPVHMPSVLTASASGLAGSFELRGDRGETRRAETSAMRYTVRDESNGQQVASGFLTGGFVALPKAGTYVAELTSDGAAFRDGTATATLTLGFDTRSGSVTLPAITSLAVLDGAGRHATSLPLHGNGSLVFSASGPLSFAGCFFRQLGRHTWVQLTPVQTAADPELGSVYRVDLADALWQAGGIEVVIELGSQNGSIARWQLAPAFVVAPVEPAHRRIVRR